jgi:hypothetical protein
MLAIAPARALDESSTAAATVLFDEAIALMDRGRYAEACPKLARSQELAPSGGTLLNLAKCYEKNSQIASAWIRYTDAAERAAAAGKPEMEKLARDAAKKLEPLVSHVVVRLREQTPDVEVRRDGEIVTASELGVPMPVDPGEHSIEATAPGRVPWRSKLSVPQTKSSLVVEIGQPSACGRHPAQNAILAPESQRDLASAWWRGMFGIGIARTSPRGAPERHATQHQGPTRCMSRARARQGAAQRRHHVGHCWRRACGRRVLFFTAPAERAPGAGPDPSGACCRSGGDFEAAPRSRAFASRAPSLAPRCSISDRTADQ